MGAITHFNDNFLIFNEDSSRIPVLLLVAFG